MFATTSVMSRYECCNHFYAGSARIEENTVNKITQVRKRNGAVVAFNADRIINAIYRASIAVGRRDRHLAESLGQRVVEKLESAAQPGDIPGIEEIQDQVETVLIESGNAAIAKAYILYRENRARKRQEHAQLASKPSSYIPWAKIWHVLDWAVSHDLHTIALLNERLARGEAAEIIHASEKAYREDVENAAAVLAQQPDARVILISGPSSSGKTTTTARLAEHLARTGKKLVALNLDHYFFDLELHPKDEFGDYDFETPQALDLELINRHLRQLIEGKTIRMPSYDFKTGKRTLDVTEKKLNADEMVLIDSLHGLYPPMTAGIDPERTFKLYLEPLLQMKDADGEFIRWTDIRLMRRILRDSVSRGYNPEQTLTHWHYVRSSEMENIVPYIHSVDYVVNSGMPYELALYRPLLLESFRAWEAKFRDDPLRQDAWTRAARVKAVLEQFSPLESDALVPDDSVVREFIGGSRYSLH